MAFLGHFIRVPVGVHRASHKWMGYGVSLVNRTGESIKTRLDEKPLRLHLLLRYKAYRSMLKPFRRTAWSVP